MGYEWYNQVDQLSWRAEELMEARIAQDHMGMLGTAPSAMDQIRSHLRAQASLRPPAALVEEAADLDEADVMETIEALASAAVGHAVDRNSEHVTRQDVMAVVDSLAYPFNPR
jgi:hypothetical protein